MKIDWKLKGNNLLKFGGGKDVTVHPETCSDMVLMGHNGSQSLTDWITKDTETGLGTSLTDWITNSFIKTVGEDVTFEINADYTPSSDSWDYTNSMLLGRLNNATDIRIPYGSIDSYGVFKVGYGLNATNGVLAVSAANPDVYGGIKLFDIGDSNIPENALPLKLSSYGKAYIDLSGGVQSDSVIYRWDEYNPTHTTTTPAINPSAYIVNENADNFSSINIYNYINTIKSLFNTSVNEYRIYPVRTDAAGHLYTFVPWTDTTYNVYNNTSTVGAGLVPYSSNSSINSTAFLGKDGTWKVPSYNNLLNKPTVFSSSTDGFVPKANNSGDNNKFLKGDGTWAVPTNTTYSADNESIIMATGNVFYDPHQYSRTTNKHREIAGHLNLLKFRKIDYKVVGLPADSSAATELGNNLFNILETIAKLPDSGSATITYGYDYDDELSWTMDSSSEFISQYSAGNIKLNIYGDIAVAADDSSNLPSSVTSLTFSTGTTSTNTHHDIAFSFVKDENQIDLTIVCIKNVAVTIS